jgi:hypothetical protein
MIVLLSNYETIDFLEGTTAAVRQAMKNVGASFEGESLAVHVRDGFAGERFEKIEVVGFQKRAHRSHVFSDARSRAKALDSNLVFLALAINEQLSRGVFRYDPSATPFFEDSALDRRTAQFTRPNLGFMGGG